MQRLSAIQESLKALVSATEAHAHLFDIAGEKSLAFATHMVKESLDAYSRELAKFVRSKFG